jgi:hypothetical protein
VKRTVFRLSILVALATAGCVGSAMPSVGSTDATQSPGATAQSSDLDLSVALTTASPVAGTAVTATVTVRNQSLRAVSYQTDGCGMPATLEVDRPTPNGSTGSAQSGFAATFKQYVMADGLDQAEKPGLGPVREPFGDSCQAVPSNLTLEPGQLVTGDKTWQTDLVPGIPLPPGPVVLTTTVQYDPLPPPTPRSPQPAPSGGLPPPNGNWFPQYEHVLAQTIDIQVAAGIGPSAMSAAQAIDAALTNVTFRSWLEGQPASSWANANIYLDARGWHVELFVDQHTFGIVILDPVSGNIRFVSTCESGTCTQ